MTSVSLKGWVGVKARDEDGDDAHTHVTALDAVRCDAASSSDPFRDLSWRHDDLEEKHAASFLSLVFLEEVRVRRLPLQLKMRDGGSHEHGQINCLFEVVAGANNFAEQAIGLHLAVRRSQRRARHASQQAPASQAAPRAMDGHAIFAKGVAN